MRGLGVAACEALVVVLVVGGLLHWAWFRVARVGLWAALGAAPALPGSFAAQACECEWASEVSLFVAWDRGPGVGCGAHEMCGVWESLVWPGALRLGELPGSLQG